MPYKDPEKARAYERERHRRRASERRSQGLCMKCGKRPPAAGRKVCAPCGERARNSERLRYARARDGGARYGGRNPESRRRMARERNRMRRRERLKAGLCTHCGDRPPVGGGTVCEPCREARRAEERELYARRRASGLCGRCGGPASGASLCRPCAALDEGPNREKRNAARRGRYARLRSQGLCTDCGEPAGGAARCEACARRSWHSSGEHKGMPVHPTRYTVVELATDVEHGPLDSWEEVAMCLAFKRLSREEVEVVTDSPWLSSLAGF